MEKRVKTSRWKRRSCATGQGDWRVARW